MPTPWEKPRMVSRRVGSILLLVQGTDVPTKREWASFINLVRAFGPGLAHARILLLTRGGGLTLDQRKSLAAVVGKATLRFAVVTDSLKMRFTTSSLAFIIPAIRSFEWDHLLDAFGHLDLTDGERARVTNLLLEMRATIGDVS